MSSWDSVRVWVCFESLFSRCFPQCPRMLMLIAFEPIAHPEQRAIDRGPVVASQFDNPGLDDETAEFDEMPRALAALDLPRAHVMPRPCRQIAPARRQCRGQFPVHFASPVPERTRLRAWTMPPSFRCPLSRPARSARP